MKNLLGGKGANLAEMTNLGIPVPPGFTISTDVCARYYENGRRYPRGLEREVEDNLHRLEELMGKRLGDAGDPLLVSVRSGAAVSMPGMMDTVLNLGMNDRSVRGLAAKSGNERFAWDAYRRFIQMFGNVVKHVEHEAFEDVLDEVKKRKGIEFDTDLDTGDLMEIVSRYKLVYRSHAKEDFPQDPAKQLWDAVDAVFGSWNNDRAIRYREINDIRKLKGTAVNIQAMVFGNFGGDSGTGVCFSRDPSTGRNEFYGEYLMDAQGEDVVAGIRTPEPLLKLQEALPVLYDQLVAVKDRLEAHYRDMQDMEFTIERGTLYILQTRNGKRTGAAAVKIAVDMVKEGLIEKETAVMRVTPDQLDQILHPMIDTKRINGLKPLARGLNASPGAATGRITFTSEDAESRAGQGTKVILVRKETSPDDIGGMFAAEGVLTSTGGMTSHAAVVARGMGKPCVVGAKEVSVSGRTMTVNGTRLSEGDWITLNGNTGDIYVGQLPLVQPRLTEDLTVFLAWADEIRMRPEGNRNGFGGLRIRTNADTPEDAKKARSFGAEGIGLCRTEHMFFEKGKLENFQEMILAEDTEARRIALKKLLPLQTKDFLGIFSAMDGYPVTIRLLDPPLHEFVPQTREDVEELSRKSGVPVGKLIEKIESLKEINPMLGHRGCRLGVVYPEIYEMQAEAIILAAREASLGGIRVTPEIMIPLIGTWQELSMLRKRLEGVIEKVLANGNGVSYRIGTMIEVPRAALTADEIAPHADFFSFGTNDMTQMTYGYSRDDIGAFLPEYLDEKILEHDPFKVLDRGGVGQLISLAIGKGRSIKGDLKMGICGEHGGDPSSIEFVYLQGVDYVSCSPYRVPIARLAAAQTVVRHGAN
jgi:pyruvate,orthophosphate dikinase